MALYGQGQVTTVTTNAAPAFDVKASANVSFRLLEFGASTGAATQMQYGFGRPGNDGSVAQTAPVLLQAEDGNNTAAAQTGTAVAWTTAPTIPTVFLRRIGVGAVIGSGFIWIFPRGIKCDVSKGLVLWNNAANTALGQLWLVCDE